MTVDLIGLTIIDVRLTMKKENDYRLGWDRPGLAIDLDNGMTIYATRDEENNGPGDIIVYDTEGYPVEYKYDATEWIE